ncbi:MAG: hypothetical protein JF616_02030 [Fibrobacteres bacterium]|jgi:hypothetical protein|nr:hypothetical protein [Fibrobacterota bacterium]
MHSRISSIACTILASAALFAAPARAESRFATNRFEITFGDGWQNQPSVGGDSSVFLMYGYSMLGFCYMTAGSGESPVSAGDFDNFRKQYAGADSVTKVAEGTDSLGGKAFAYSEFKNADTSNGDTRIRLYSTSDGSLRFQSLLVYEYPVGTLLVSAMDSALATLALSPTAIHALQARSPLVLRAADHDVLGRLRPLAMRPTSFRLPGR